MTIDEHKEHLLDIMDSMPDDACGDWRDSLAYALDTMRKYQKIEQIVSDFREYQKGISCGFGGATYMQMVREVVDNGNDNS